MPRSRHDHQADDTRLKANRVFTDRDAPKAQFDQARAELPPDQHRLLVFYGVGGQGKTALRRELMRRLAAEQPRRHRFGAVDFYVKDFRDPPRGLLELRRRLGASGKIRTPVFDVAIARYWERAYPGEDVTRALDDLFSDGDGILSELAQSGRDALDLAEDVPFGVGQTLKLINRAHRWLKDRGAHRACAALADLPALEADQIAERLPWYLGLDLQAHRADHPEQGAPICFLDTYEALWSDAPDKTGAAAVETDAWVRELISAAPGTLFVILGRERLSWDRRFPDDDWAALLAEQHLLGGLAEADADWFLCQIPIDDAAIRRAIIDGASAENEPDPPPGATGAHPFYLDLAVDTWLKLCAAGTPPRPGQFGGTHADVLARFLRHRDPAEIEALRVLAGPAGFDRDLFGALMAHFRTGYPSTRFPELCDLSIIEPGADGRWRLHALMRAHLLADLDPDLRRALHAFLFEWYDARCRPPSPREITPEHETALREAFDHRDSDDAEAALGWFWQRQTVFYDAARHGLLEPLCRRALALAEERLGAEHAETATALNNLGTLLQATNRLTEAEPLMRRALAIDEASYGAGHPDVATDLNNLGLLLQDTNRLAEAEPLMRRALAIDEASYGAEHPTVARDLNNLGLLLKATNRLAEAEPLMRRALAIDEASYGVEHPAVGRDLNNLAQLLQATNRLAEAEPLMRRALAIDEASYRAEHPDVAIHLNNLALLLMATNRLAEAEPLMRRALAIDEASYGAEHPDVARDLNNLAQLLQDTNRLAEAEPLSRRMVLIFLAFTRDTGHRHPHLRAAIGNYRGLLLAQAEDPTEIAPRLASLGPEAGLDEATWAALLAELLGEPPGAGGAP
ncbi:tetratricopeptide repeat protein [Thiohalocapsa sp. ML1]|uniref:tetratricopeptide repeat protein n=1 Tax=Thiohalocapsa sp. ML1 TaxID=1431688 RepID=UPI0007320BE0|nr:tetratricopeptide repeat protein [Thiohalocapsa sp. ML1]